MTFYTKTGFERQREGGHICSPKILYNSLKSICFPRDSNSDTTFLLNLQKYIKVHICREEMSQGIQLE